MQLCYIISDIDKAVYFEQTALSLRESGIEVSFILINCTHKNLHHFLIKQGFEVFTLENQSLLKSGNAIRKCKAILKQINVDLVHCHLAHANWIGLWAARLAKVKTRIYTRHSGEPLQLRWKERFIDKIQNRLATKIVAISKNIDELLEKQGVAAKKRVLIHHGFELARFSNPLHTEIERLRHQYNPEHKKPVFGMVARWMEWKGIQYTIDAFKKLLEHHPDALLCLFGATENADYSAQLKIKLHEIPEQNLRVVTFENNVFDLYQLFDGYIHVPVNASCEAFGQTYVEALAAQIPSIFTLSGVAREFISHEENALVVPFRDSNAIYDAMIRILNDEQLCTKLKTNGVRDVNHLFGFSTYISNLQKLYTS